MPEKPTTTINDKKRNNADKGVNKKEQEPSIKKVKTSNDSNKSYLNYLDQLDTCISTPASSSSGIITTTSKKQSSTSSSDIRCIPIANSNYIPNQLKKDLLNIKINGNLITELTKLQSLTFEKIYKGMDFICELSNTFNSLEFTIENYLLSYLIPILSNVLKIITKNNKNQNFVMICCSTNEMKEEFKKIILNKLPNIVKENVISFSLEENKYPILILTINELINFKNNKNLKCLVFHFNNKINDEDLKNLKFILENNVGNKLQRQTICYANGITTKISEFISKEMMRKNPPLVKCDEMILPLLNNNSVSGSVVKAFTKHYYIPIKFNLKIIYLFSLIKFLSKKRKFKEIFIYFYNFEEKEFYSKLFEMTKECEQTANKTNIYLLSDDRAFDNFTNKDKLIKRSEKDQMMKSMVIHFDMPKDNATFEQRNNLGNYSILFYTKKMNDKCDEFFKERTLNQSLQRYDKFNEKEHVDFTIQYQCEKIISKDKSLTKKAKHILQRLKSEYPKWVEHEIKKKGVEKLLSAFALSQDLLVTDIYNAMKEILQSNK
ncbi:hypothetical protein ABK040_001768 [Willaertia magna]